MPSRVKTSGIDSGCVLQVLNTIDRPLTVFWHKKNSKAGFVAKRLLLPPAISSSMLIQSLSGNLWVIQTDGRQTVVEG